MDPIQYDVLIRCWIFERFNVREYGGSRYHNRDLAFDGFGKVVRVLNRPATGDQYVYRNKGAASRRTGAQGMELDAFVAMPLQHCFDGGSLLSIERAVEQSQSRASNQLEAREYDVGGYHQSDDRVQSVPACDSDSPDREDDTRRCPNVCQ